jgi:hypothetical protein
MTASPNTAASDREERRSSRDASPDRRPLSEALWGIRWSDHLPLALGPRTSVRASTFERSLPFIRAHYATIFEDDGTSPFKCDAVTAHKARYYDLCADFFEFLSDDKPIGLLVCDPTDWGTYYIRSAALLPEHQGSHVIQRFLNTVLFDTLAAAGVERVDMDVSPSNIAMLHIATRLRCNATGTVLSERWGALTRFTRFLKPDAHRLFLGQFCGKTVPPTAAALR